jgi:hypothetical protein
MRRKQQELEYHGATAGGKQPKLYQLWSQIKQRCYNKKCKKYPDYGGRGIDMDPRWKESYATFQTDIDEILGPHKDRSLGRKDIEKGYWPENVVWLDPKALRRNTRKNHFVEFRGKQRTLGEVSEMTGVDHRRLQHRIVDQKMSVEEAVSLPFEHGIEFYTYKGESHKLSGWAEILKLPYHVLYDRIHKLGWPIERAFRERVE